MRGRGRHLPSLFRADGHTCPLFHHHAGRPWLVAMALGITAAATGAIVAAVFVLGRQSVVDSLTVMIALTAWGLTWLPRKIPDPVIVLGAGLAGLLAGSPG
jgi:chromate transporter